MQALALWSALLASLGAGFVGGLCFAFGSFQLRAFDRLGAAQAIRSMQSINATILRSSAMPLWWGTALAGAIAAFASSAGALRWVPLAAYVAGALLVTGRANVPLNEALDRVDPDAPEAEQEWSSYRVRWGRWNALRTALCALAALGFAWLA